tara:strand:- start:138 stop:1127 length:990 start_codon:yes stop_codon:yes gene_type:complete
MENLNRFCTYAFLREDKIPYYIGKNNGKRIYISKGIEMPKDKNKILILKENLTEEEAYKHKIYMISIFGRKHLGTGILHNRNDGSYGNKKIRKRKNNINVKRKRNLIDCRFGKLLVIKELDGKRKPCGSLSRVFLCKCDCGNEKGIRISDLTTGRTTSCGCKTRKHGKRNSRIYVIWRGMKARCLNPKSPSYKNYGGNGVTIDERWMNFENFYEDMGDPPDRMTLDKDVIVKGNKVYAPGLCKWSTPAEQSVNKMFTTKKSKYVYVSWNKIKEKWQVILPINGKGKKIGTYYTEEDAAKVVCNYFNINLVSILRKNWIPPSKRPLHKVS